MNWQLVPSDRHRPGMNLHRRVTRMNDRRLSLPFRHLAAALGAAMLVVATAAPAGAQAKAGPVFQNGQAQVVPAFADSARWIREELWVVTDFDSDQDGRKDRVHVAVTRQAQTETEGLKVPVIFASSPYFAGTGSSTIGFWDVKSELGVGFTSRDPMPVIPFRAVRPRISNAEVMTWVPRGFAVVHSEAPGTGLSQGCPTVGGRPEEHAPKAVIDWLNGRAKGYTTIDGDVEVKANWTTGKVGMTGTSYNGTLPLAAATTGVKGLEAIIPIAPNTSYYHYYRSNGLVRSPGGYLGEDVSVLYDFVHSGDPATRPTCDALIRDGLFVRHSDRASGDYNSFWADRDLLPKVKKIRAAVLLAHGTNDWNVTPDHSVRIYEALKARKSPAMLYLHQGGHGGAPPMEVMNQWWSHYLYGVDNGIDRAPRALIMREGLPRGAAPTAYPDYPVPGSAPVTLHPAAGGATVGALGWTASAGPVTERLVDDVQYSSMALATAAASPNRLLYATPLLADSVHLSGTPRVTIRLASSKPAANLSVYLVALPFDTARVGSSGRAGVITRSWADPQNAKQLRRGGDYNAKGRGTPLRPGEFVTLTFDLQPDDQVIPPGKRLGLMIFSSDREFTLWPAAGTELTVDLAGTSITLPVVGGAAALRRALGN